MMPLCTHDVLLNTLTAVILQLSLASINKMMQATREQQQQPPFSHQQQITSSRSSLILTLCIGSRSLNSACA